ncbi:hypothetical protein [Chitinophaga sp.]|uniref:hypothetical protein n=1 Tax=Chitinophaga sp. TaxID=1869181 RepID=UPI002F95ABB0
MMISPDIENTEAGIIPDDQGKPHGRIIKLSGVMGKEEIALYPIKECIGDTYLGIILESTVEYNMVQISTLYQRTKLLEGDDIIFHFEDENAIRRRFQINGHHTGARKSNTFLISNDQLLYIIHHPLQGIEIIDNHTGINTCYYFGALPTQQYNTPDDGKTLFQIMARRIAGAKLMMMEI